MTLEFPTIPLEQFRPVKLAASASISSTVSNSELMKYLSSYHPAERRDMKIRVEFPPIFSSTSKSTWLSTRKVAAELRQQDKELKEQQKEIENPWLLRGSGYHPANITEKLRNGLNAAGNMREVNKRIPLSEEIPVNKSTKVDLAIQVRQGLLMAGKSSLSLGKYSPETKDDLSTNSSSGQRSECCYSISVSVSDNEDNALKSMAEKVKEGLILAGGNLDTFAPYTDYISSRGQMSESCSSTFSHTSPVIEDNNLKSMAERVREGLLLAGGQLDNNEVKADFSVSSSQDIDMSQRFSNIYNSDLCCDSNIDQEMDEQQAAPSPAETLKMSMHAFKSIESLGVGSELQESLSKMNIEDEKLSFSDLVSQWVIADIGDSQSEASIITLDTLANTSEDFDDFCEIDNELSQWRA